MGNFENRTPRRLPASLLFPDPQVITTRKNGSEVTLHSNEAVMDLSLLGAGEVAEETALRSRAHEVVNLTSESESDADDDVATHHLSTKVAEAVEESQDAVTGLVGTDGEDEDGDEAWESESLFEDTIQEMGDEHLLDGGML